MVDIDHGRFDRVSGLCCRALPGDGLRPERSLRRLGDDRERNTPAGSRSAPRSAPIPAVTSCWRSLRCRKRVTRSQSLERIERELGVPCRHLSYPYGDECSAGEQSEFGMRTGVTTRKGLIQRRHASALTALPRVSLNGDHQHPRYVKVFLNGAPFTFANRRQRQAAQTAPFH